MAMASPDRTDGRKAGGMKKESRSWVSRYRLYQAQADPIVHFPSLLERAKMRGYATATA